MGRDAGFIHTNRDTCIYTLYETFPTVKLKIK